MAEDNAEVRETQEQETLTPEQELANLREQLAQAQARATEKDKGFRSLQQQLSVEQARIQQLESRQEDREYLKAITAVLANQAGQTPEDFEAGVQANKPNLVNQLDTVMARLDANRKRRDFTARITSYEERADALGLPKTDKVYRQIRAATVSGDFALADELLEQYATKPEAEKLPEVKVLTEEEKQQIALEVLRKEGKLTQESGRPSASRRKTYTREEIASMSPQEYKEARERGDLQLWSPE